MLPPESCLPASLAAHVAPDHVINSRGTTINIMYVNDPRAGSQIRSVTLTILGDFARANLRRVTATSAVRSACRGFVVAVLIDPVDGRDCSDADEDNSAFCYHV